MGPSAQQSYQRTKTILTHQHSFIWQRRHYIATYIDPYKVIIKQIYRNVILVTQLYFLIWFHIITIFCHLFSDILLFLNISNMTHMARAKQRLYKDVPEVTLSTTEGRLKAGIMKSG
jgi:hypothetical protein